SRAAASSAAHLRRTIDARVSGAEGESRIGLDTEDPDTARHGDLGAPAALGRRLSARSKDELGRRHVRVVRDQRERGLSVSRRSARSAGARGGTTPSYPANAIVATDRTVSAPEAACIRWSLHSCRHLFGASTPASKVLLASLEPFQLAGLLYLGA